MDNTLWEGVSVAMQSAIAAADTVTAITKANPGVATATAHGLSNGAFVRMDVLGMHQVDERVFRVANIAANTFELEGEDTSSYDTFSSGSAYELTFGTTISSFTSIQGNGGDFNFVDTSTIHQLVRSQIPGQANPISYNFDSVWDPADAGLAALLAASKLKAKRAFRFTFSNGKIMLFSGYVGATLIPVGSSGELVKTPIVITSEGVPTYYAS